MRIPRLIISGLSGGSGKTMVSLGLSRALSRRPAALSSAAFLSQGSAPSRSPESASRLRVRTFKKGPDYIDAAWLALASGSGRSNLDPFFCPPDQLRRLFLAACAGHDLAIVEGNRGLFDGLDLTGSCSTAELARILEAPVALVLDCTKMTRTAAALVAGCRDFEPGLRLGGVILNRTGNARHQSLVRAAVEELAGVPVLGVLPRRPVFIPERHMGLAGTDELAAAHEHLDRLADFIEAHLDLEKVLALAADAPELPSEQPEERSPGPPPTPTAKDAPERSLLTRPLPPPDAGRRAAPRIGYAHDAAFWFYYRENLDALTLAGAELTPVSLLEDGPLPSLDGLYLGGGLPELHAAALAGNHIRRAAVADCCRQGMPVYAECGGFIYLAESLRVGDVEHPMSGALPCRVEMRPRPQGLGYVEAEVIAENPWHPAGTLLRGHEFHFSRAVFSAPPPAGTFALRLRRGSGMLHPATDDRCAAKAPHIGRFAEPCGPRPDNMCPDGPGLDGLCQGNTFAAYTHIYAPAAPHWAAAFVRLCLRH